MAESDSKEEVFLECSLCFENDELKRLPCNPGHIYCVTCLTKDSEVTKIVKCPLCRSVFDECIDDIPSAGAPLDKFLCCDVCMRKDDRRRLAQIYCVICSKKFCTPHEKSHNDALDDHRRIRMDEYKRDYRKMETRYCEKHPTKVYIMACLKCPEVFCVDCVHQSVSCSDGNRHELIPISNIVEKLTDMINEKKVWIYDKEEHLLGMSKQLTAVISDWDTETKQMIEKLHQARDEQVLDLMQKYAELEKKLLERRNQSRIELTSFLDDEIGSLLDKLSRQVARIDTRLHTYHEVDVAGGYKETEKLIDELMNMKIPQYKLSSNHVQLSDTDNGDVQLAVKISQSSQKLIDLPTLANLNPPTSMKLVNTVKHSSYVSSVTKQQNYIYAGLHNHKLMRGIDTLNTTQLTEFVNCGGQVSSVQVYKDELYVLSHQTNKVYVYDLDGKLKRSWSHNSNIGYYNKLRVVNEKVVVPDGVSQALTLYTLQGQLIKQIKVPGMSTNWKALAVCGDDSVILSDYGTNSIHRMNIDSGEVMWTSKHVTRPEGVVCYKDRYVLVSNCNTDTKIWILDIDTGEKVGEIQYGQTGVNTHQFDLDIYDDILLVAKHNQHTVQCYQLITE